MERTSDIDNIVRHVNVDGADFIEEEIDDTLEEYVDDEVPEDDQWNYDNDEPVELMIEDND
ncbi:hypothetical protein TIFTF001_024157 [Ficus carica]|uniref:Uncharacterized protein n=1 Tax=Ficus carica TaxID=3494 RepID=A0AA88DFV0_FICCA|nr:hypothetical protein TIFTF001_024157 [Ficus carica]